MSKKSWQEWKEEKKLQKTVDKYWKVAMQTANKHLNREQRRRIAKQSHARG